MHALVYYEVCADMRAAIILEKQLKDMNRRQKLDLIEIINLDWHDLYQDIV